MGERWDTQLCPVDRMADAESTRQGDLGRTTRISGIASSRARTGRSR